jgi:hypothetical protein
MRSVIGPLWMCPICDELRMDAELARQCLIHCWTQEEEE